MKLKYKVGDRVRIRRDLLWGKNILEDFNKLPNGVVTIKVVATWSPYYYFMEEIGYGWQESEIEGLEEVPVLDISRFELLDFE